MAEETKDPIVVVVDQSKSNTSIKYNPITTILGFTLMGMGLAFGICIWFVPLFYTIKTDILKYWWIYFMPFAPIILGVIAIFAPDKIISFGGRALDSASDRIKEGK